MAIDPRHTVQAMTLLFLFGGIGLIWLLIRRKREQMKRSRPVSRPAIAMTKPAKNVLAADVLTLGARPKLEDESAPHHEGDAPSVLASLLASRLGDERGRSHDPAPQCPRRPGASSCPIPTRR